MLKNGSEHEQVLGKTAMANKINELNENKIK